MAGSIEREFKLRIPSEAALEALRTALGGEPSTPVLQVNHFFDTSARDLGRARIALRLREEAGTVTLTLKGPTHVERDALASRAELELDLDATTARAVLSGTRSPLDVLGSSAHAQSELVGRAAALSAGAPLARLGCFENERQRVGPVSFPPGSKGPPLVFELDRTHFPGGGLERELELELPEGADAAEVERALAALFARAGLAIEPAPSKLARFLRALDSAAKPG